MSALVDHHKTAKPDVAFVEALMARLTDLSVQNYYNPYSEFKWADAIEENTFWLSPELLSIHGTEHYSKLSTQELMLLSKWESINIYSATVYGERDLILSVLKHMHEPSCSDAAEYFYHFVEEETKHMWLFAQFCHRYGKKVYEPKGLDISTLPFQAKELVAVVAFAKILIFEAMGDYYNKYMMNDERLPEVVRSLNRLHHLDESRHIAMGQTLLTQLTDIAAQTCGTDGIKSVTKYLDKFMSIVMQLFYNPAVYQDAGIPDAYQLRAALLKSPERAKFHSEVLSRANQFLVKSGLRVY